jgi:molecular chaperone DnaK (HSP70)
VPPVGAARPGAVKELFGRERKDANPDEARAVGAAIQGQVLPGDRTRCAAARTPRCPWVLKTMVVSHQDDQEKNTTHSDQVWCRRSQPLKTPTQDDQGVSR